APRATDVGRLARTHAGEARREWCASWGLRASSYWQPRSGGRCLTAPIGRAAPVSEGAKLCPGNCKKSQMISETPTSPDSFDEPIRIVLVGNERVTRAGLRLLIDSHPGLLVVAEEECTGDLVALMATAEPQIAIIDLDGTSNVEFIPNVREAGLLSTRIIVLTSTPDSVACANAVQRGVLGIVSKQQAPEILIKAIERVHAGEVWLNRARIAGVLGSLR